MDTVVRGLLVGMRVCTPLPQLNVEARPSTYRGRRIVEYATRDQAQTAVNTLSNQNLMGRLVYVREVKDSKRPPWSIYS